MAPASSENESEEFNTPHLPERYRQQVKAKKQRRLRKRLRMAAAAILLIAVLCILLNIAMGGIFTAVPAQSAAQNPPPGAGNTVPAATGTGPVVLPNSSGTFTRGPGLAAPLPQGVLSPERAVAALRSEYPGSGFVILNADLTSSGGRFLYSFTLHPAGEGAGPDFGALVDARTGDPYSPGEETAVVSRADAKQKALSYFPELHPDRVILTFTSTTGDGKRWYYVMYNGDTKTAAGAFDADTGKLSSYFRYLPAGGRPASPAIDAEKARSIADQYIIDHNGGQLPLNMSSAGYQPFSTPDGQVAGQYVFTYERTFQDFLTDTDGFEVNVDASTGEVTGYTQQWTTPEYAFSASAEPDIIRREATFAVLQKAKEQFPADIGGLRIVSAEIRWKNRVPYGTVPRPGTIPLEWKVVFDDDVIRANASAQPGVAWLDVQTGKILEFDYRH
jgi:hypothetical protein